MCKKHTKAPNTVNPYSTHRFNALQTVPVFADASFRGCRSIAPKTQASHYAFTVVEILIVIVIMAIAAMLAVPMISSAETFQIRSAANMIAADLEYAKSMAISRGQFYSVVFDSVNESYEIQDHDGNVIQHPVKKGFPYEVDFKNDSRLSRVNIDSANFNGTSNEVKFDYLGSPYDGSDPPSPLNSGDVRLKAGEMTRTISVEPVTGYISISE